MSSLSKVEVLHHFHHIWVWFVLRFRVIHEDVALLWDPRLEPLQRLGLELELVEHLTHVGLILAHPGLVLNHRVYLALLVGALADGAASRFRFSQDGQELLLLAHHRCYFLPLVRPRSCHLLQQILGILD